MPCRTIAFGFDEVRFEIVLLVVLLDLLLGGRNRVCRESESTGCPESQRGFLRRTAPSEHEGWQVLQQIVHSPWPQDAGL